MVIKLLHYVNENEIVVQLFLEREACSAAQ